MRQILNVRGITFIIQSAWIDVNNNKGRMYIHAYSDVDRSSQLVGAYEIDLEDVVGYDYDAIVTILRENGWVNPS